MYREIGSDYNSKPATARNCHGSQDSGWKSIRYPCGRTPVIIHIYISGEKGKRVRARRAKRFSKCVNRA